MLLGRCGKTLKLSRSIHQFSSCTGIQMSAYISISDFTSAVCWTVHYPLSLTSNESKETWRGSALLQDCQRREGVHDHNIVSLTTQRKDLGQNCIVAQRIPLDGFVRRCKHCLLNLLELAITHEDKIAMPRLCRHEISDRASNHVCRLAVLRHCCEQRLEIGQHLSRGP
jgi:hypothetical protein